MKSEWRRYAPIGLYLALAAVLAAFVLFTLQREWNLYLQISLGLIVVGLALYAVLDPDKVRTVLTGRQARYGSNAAILSLAFIGILVVVNYLAYTNTKRWDLTEDKQNTLAPETVDTLKTLPQPVLAQAFYSQSMNSNQARTLLDQYKFNGGGNFDYRFIDPVKEPVLANEAGITGDGNVVLTMGDRRELVTTVTEQEMTGALVKLLNTKKPFVYFLTGHGEMSIEGGGERSYSQVKAALEGKNYTVQTLNLLSTNQIPEDADVIVVAGPDKPVSAAEVALLKGFLDAGGALIVMEEPLPLTQFDDAADPLAEMLQTDWGIILGKDFVVDLSSQQIANAVSNEYGSSPVTQPLKDRFMASVFPTARSVTLTQGQSGVSQVELVKTSQRSWAETDLAALKSENAQVKPDEGVDLVGPVPVAALSENFTSKARVVVFGDADFASDNAFTFLGNGDLFINSVDWTAGQESIISLTPKDTTQRLLLPPQKVQMNLILLGSVIVIPGLALLSGIWVFIQRRRRG